MQYVEKYCDLFLFEKTHYLVHCISADYKLGAGIAVRFDRKYNMRHKLISSKIFCTGPGCVLIDNTFNLVTKKYYYLKPTYRTLSVSLEKMKEVILQKNITKIAMPRIGCGLDRLDWEKVRYIIQDTFKELNIEIVVCLQ